MTSQEARFLLKRLLGLIVTADELVNASATTPEHQQKFEMLKREIEAVNARLQTIQNL